MILWWRRRAELIIYVREEDDTYTPYVRMESRLGGGRLRRTTVERVVKLAQRNEHRYATMTRAEFEILHGTGEFK